MKQKITTKIIKISALTISLIVAFNFISPNFLDESTVRAVGDLTVNWGVLPEGSPIFVVNNIAPGQSETRDIVVTNGGTETRSVGVRSVIVDDTDSLSSMMDIVINDGVSDLYGGASPTGPKTLTNFFAEANSINGIFLSNINAGLSTTYTFDVKFQDGAGNEFQNTQVVFDLIIGISIDLPDECEQMQFSGSPIFGTSKGDSLKGTTGNDLIVGFEGGDSIDGKGGDDCILGGDGGDSIKGGAGKDVIDGQAGGDSIKGENGDDILIGGIGGDSLDGGNGLDLLLGGDGNDSLDGGNENDKLYAGDGDDSLSGGNAKDELYGEAGKDSLKGGTDNDVLIGGAGVLDSASGNSGTDVCEAESESSCELDP